MNHGPIDLAAFEATREQIAADPEGAASTFSTRTSWTGGAGATTVARSFEVRTDGQGPIGGADEAMGPMELALCAIGTCLTIGFVTHAALRGLDLRALHVEVTGDYDLRGFLGVDPDVRPGFRAVRYRIGVDADAAQEVLDEVRLAAERYSPTVDTVVAPTEVDGSLVTGPGWSGSG